MPKTVCYTKNDLINHIAEEAGITKTAARKALEATMDGISSIDAPLTLRGFGTFRFKERAARNSPLTGQVNRYRQLTFKSSRQLRTAV